MAFYCSHVARHTVEENKNVMIYGPVVMNAEVIAYKDSWENVKTVGISQGRQTEKTLAEQSYPQIQEFQEVTQKGLLYTLENQQIDAVIQDLTKAADIPEYPYKPLTNGDYISFDVFGYELWATLLNGLTLVLSTTEEQNDFVKLNDLILKNNVNVIYGTPSKIQSLVSASNSYDSFKLLSDIGIGGESFNLTFVRDLKLITSANIYNMYGPTEATVGCCAKKISLNNKIITIGKPLANVKFYVLDSNLKLCPPGIKGELYISGDGISKGYYKKDELNKKSFINDVFNKDLTMYKSGDIVSWTKER